MRRNKDTSRFELKLGAMGEGLVGLVRLPCPVFLCSFGRWSCLVSGFLSSMSVFHLHLKIGVR